jgi:hypothetical protein
MPKGRQPDVSYVVYSQRGGEKVSLKLWPEACAAATSGSLEDRTAYVLDVYVHNEVGARRFAGDAGAQRFRQLGDPSRVFERIEIRADSLGVPS